VLSEFRSPSIFAGIAGLAERRELQTARRPGTDARHKQLYMPDSNILLTRFLCSEGIAEVSDFMPVTPEGNSGAFDPPCQDRQRRRPLSNDLRPAVDYGRAGHKLHLKKKPGTASSVMVPIKQPCACGAIFR